MRTCHRLQGWVMPRAERTLLFDEPGVLVGAQDPSATVPERTV